MGLPSPPWKIGDHTICPYGHLSWIIPLLAIFGTFFFCFAAFECTLTIARSAYAEYYIGYWARESTAFAISNGEDGDGNICSSWGNSAGFDGLWKFGKAVGVLGAFTTILPTLFDLLLLYRRLEEQWFPPLIVIHFGNAMMCLFLLGGLASEVCTNELCELARGSVVAILGAIIWITDGILLMCLRRKEKLLVEEEEEEADEEQPEFLALPAPEQRKSKKLALPAAEEPREAQPEYPALPPAQELESDSDEENEVYNDDLKRLPASDSKKKKKKKNLKALPPSEQEEQDLMALPPSESSGKKKKRKSKR